MEIFKVFLSNKSQNVDKQAFRSTFPISIKASSSSSDSMSSGISSCKIVVIKAKLDLWEKISNKFVEEFPCTVNPEIPENFNIEDEGLVIIPPIWISADS